MLFLPPHQEHFVMNDDFFSSSSYQQGDFVKMITIEKVKGFCSSLVLVKYLYKEQF